MRILSAVFALVALLGIPGCATAPAVRMSDSTPTRVDMIAAEGRPKDLKLGANRAYWLWKDEDRVWHLRTTAARRGHQFEGVIRPFPGAEIVDVRGVGLGPNAQLGMAGRTVTFQWHTKQGMDGFDFRVNGGDCLEFELRINQDGDPAHIYVGKGQFSPQKEHFLLCP
jgi:hypothetical protein